MTGVKAAIANVANVDRSKVVWKMPVRSSAVILVLITAFALADRPLQAVPLRTPSRVEQATTASTVVQATTV